MDIDYGGGARGPTGASATSASSGARRRFGRLTLGVLLAGLGILPFVNETSADPKRVIEVEIRSLSFQKAELTVRSGTTVRWVNRDPVPHTTTSVEEVWDSSLIEPGESYEFTFDDEGRYSYFCVPHPFMQARVIVTR